MDILPDGYKTIENLDTFKIKIKIWKPEYCPYRLCTVYIDKEDFLQQKAWIISKKVIICTNVLMALSSQSMYICNPREHIQE